MLNCKFSDPSNPFVQYNCDSMKEDLESLFGGDEDELFSGLDFSRFDIDDLDLSVFESSYDSEDDSDGERLNSKFREIGNHDCMWGGQCCNKEYQRTQVPPPRVLPPAPAPTPNVLITHSSNKVVTIQKCVSSGKCSERTDVVVVTNNVRTTPMLKSEGRSLLLNRTTVQPQARPLVSQTHASPLKTVVKRELPTPQSSRPETPQSMAGSDDDLGPIPIDTHNTTSIFRSALDALTTPSSGDWEDDLLVFSDAKRTKNEKVSVPSQPDIVRISASATSDHNYDGSNKNLRLEGLGVDTPSDSEEDEEIDVVSLSDRSSSSRSSSCSGSGLPTRPTARDQEHLEEITTSLLSASEAVSRKLKKTISTQGTKHKRKKYRSESSDCDDDDYDTPVYTKHHRQIKRQKTQMRRKKTSRFGEEEDSEEKRYLHNNMERMRRIDLRNSFEELKALVPGLASKDRAAKVVILREAANYCCELGSESQSKQMQVQALRKEQLRLRSMVSSLRKAAAMACVKNPKHF